MKLYDAMLKQDRERPVTENVTKKRVPKSLVTQIREMAKRGRPRKPDALSPVERQRRSRARRKAAHG